MVDSTGVMYLSCTDGLISARNPIKHLISIRITPFSTSANCPKQTLLMKINLIWSKVKICVKDTKTLWGKEENAGYQHFLLFPTMFLKRFSSCQDTELLRLLTDLCLRPFSTPIQLYSSSQCTYS